jgi:hypothetical protein
MFVYNGLNTLCGVFILYLLRKARGCCMHVFSSFIKVFTTVKVHIKEFSFFTEKLAMAR